MKNRYYAHIKYDSEEERVSQTLKEHSGNVAAYASKDLCEANLSEAAFFAGLLHDMGKAKEEFQKYLLDAAEGKSVVRGSVNHTFAAVRYCFSGKCERQNKGEDAPGEDEVFAEIICELLAYAMGAHHGEFDLVNDKYESGFLHRLENESIGYEEAENNFFKVCANESAVRDAYLKASDETRKVLCVK